MHLTEGCMCRSRALSDSLNKTQTQGTKQEKLFFFYAQKLLQPEKNLAESLLEQCEKLARQCNEVKVDTPIVQILPEAEPPRTSSPTKEQPEEEQLRDKDSIAKDPFSSAGINISAVLSPGRVETEHAKSPERDRSTVSFFQRLSS